MIIRKADKADKLQIQALMDELNSYRRKIFTSNNKNFHERINPYSPLEDKDFDGEFIFVALDSSQKIVGFIRGSIDFRKNHKLRKLGYIDELYLKEESRGQGIAKGLLVQLESEFKQEGCDHMTTHTDFENALSQQFYLQAGMQKATVEFWKEL